MKRVLQTALTTILICIGLLILTAMIPQSAIKGNVSRSAEELMELELFDHVTDNVFPSRQDNYADAILVNIIYNIDSCRLLKSLVSMPYYNPENENVNVSLQNAIESATWPFASDGALNDGYVDYSRYWHGSQVLLRPLLILMPLGTIRMLLGMIVIALNLALIVGVILVDGGSASQAGGRWPYNRVFSRNRIAAICYGLALIIVSVWMCAFCIEYVTSFLIVSFQLLKLYSCREKLEATKLYTVLCAGGIVTAFMDFLTTETITLTLPMLFYFIWLEITDDRDATGVDTFDNKNWYTLLWGTVIWGLSYAGMMMFKWIIALIVLGKDAILKAFSMASLRIAGDATYGNIPGADAVSNAEQITGALWRNLACLFPFGESINKGKTMLFSLIALSVIFTVWYLFHKKLDRVNGQFTLIFLTIGLVPYLRFLILNNHSYIHFFFTYRAQLVTITALLYLAFRDLGGIVLQKPANNRKMI